jgi:hypothetical protein
VSPRIAHRPVARRRATAALLLAALLTSASASADQGVERSDEEVTRRLAFIESRLGRAAGTANLWWTLWYYGYVVVTVGQAGFAILVKDRGLRTDTAVGGAFATLGVLGIGIAGLPAKDAPRLLYRLPESTPEERRRKLAEGERLLAESARAEIGGKSWVAHVVGVAVTLAGGLTQAFAYKRYTSSIVTIASGVAITEAQIYTKPTAAIDDWRAYQAGAWSGGARSAVRPRPPPLSVVAQPGGMGLSLAF